MSVKTDLAKVEALLAALAIEEHQLQIALHHIRIAQQHQRACQQKLRNQI